MRRRDFLAAAGSLLLAACTPSVTTPTSQRASRPPRTSGPAPASPSGASVPGRRPARGTPQQVMARSTVPVLCFHQLRDFRPDDSRYARTMITPPAAFTAQLQAIRDGGYTAITAQALVDHLDYGTALPPRPVLLTFDDGSATHHSVALPGLERFGCPAMFFPMTVVLNKPNWLSDGQLRALDRAGMTIGAHTWDHRRLDRLAGDRWRTELEEPKARLGKILGHPVDLMAYPYGVWSQETLAHVRAAGYRAAFQLAGPQDPAQPLLTIRRIMPPPTWDAPTLQRHLQQDFRGHP
jgi:peptidoglycan/xylan/chitin deacetylase (PgdA/CDA1 family)